MPIPPPLLLSHSHKAEQVDVPCIYDSSAVNHSAAAALSRLAGSSGSFDENVLDIRKEKKKGK